MVNKYVMLYNCESTKDKREAKDFLQVMPEAKLLKYGVMTGLVDGTAEIQKKKMSLWIPEHLFLMAWTYFNHKCLTRGEVGFESGIDYLNKHLNDHRFVKKPLMKVSVGHDTRNVSFGDFQWTFPANGANRE